MVNSSIEIEKYNLFCLTNSMEVVFLNEDFKCSFVWKISAVFAVYSVSKVYRYTLKKKEEKKKKKKKKFSTVYTGPIPSFYC